MRAKWILNILVLLFSFSIISCTKSLPQLPSNKNKKTDKSASSLMIINHELAMKEDNILKKYADSIGSFKKSGIGFWHKIYKSGSGSIIKDSVSCKFYSTLELLNGKILETKINQLIIGKRQTIVGLEEGIKLMHKGDSATFIIPWYLGYGMIGKDKLIPPYTSIIYKIRILEE